MTNGTIRPASDQSLQKSTSRRAPESPLKSAAHCQHGYHDKEACQHTRFHKRQRLDYHRQRDGFDACLTNTHFKSQQRQWHADHQEHLPMRWMLLGSKVSGLGVTSKRRACYRYAQWLDAQRCTETAERRVDAMTLVSWTRWCWIRVTRGRPPKVRQGADPHGTSSESPFPLARRSRHKHANNSESRDDCGARHTTCPRAPPTHKTRLTIPVSTHSATTAPTAASTTFVPATALVERV